MKRLLDIVLAALLLIALIPLLTLLCTLQLLISGKPVFFRQDRTGLNGVSFSILKLRTMRTGKDDDAERLTSWGKFLRSTSLDELPELWNVLRGEMSLVGPRPLPTRYLSRYSPEQARRHTVRPGITGWAQINGRNAVSWERQFELDLWYVDHRSGLLDIKIILLTLMVLPKLKHISEQGHATRSEFTGN